MTLNTYEGLHARYYDVVYSDKPYGDEARFVDELLLENGGSRTTLLDVACGTGRHAAVFVELGWEVTGVDYAEPLLEHARRNAPGARFFRQDMRDLDVDGRPFGAVTCLFDAIGYPQTDAGVIAALAAMRAHVADGGGVVVEFLHAPALVAHAAAVRVRRWPLGDGELVRISTSAVDAPSSLMRVDYELIELRGDGTYERWEETQTNRFFTVEEMRVLFAAADLPEPRFVTAYERGAAIDETTFHVLALSKAAG